MTYYDDPKFDYQKYWTERVYEDKAERIALQRLFRYVSPKKTLIDIGGGFGRLTSEYAPLFQKCFLLDPSEKLLRKAKTICGKYKNLSFKRGFIENLPFKNQSFDTAICIRTIHHLENLPKTIEEISRILKPKGYLILEFANKMRFKNILRAIFSFNFNFFTNHQPVNISSKKNAVPFFSYHPNQIKTLLLANGFEIKKILSVSNFRQPQIKKIIPLKLLLRMESFFSLLSSYFPPFQFWGPSIFILAQKKK